MPMRIERRTGVAAWRQIADRLRADIAAAGDRTDQRLAPETELAERFGVNRHTVRSAVASLVAEGLLRAEQGRGTFIVPPKRMTYPLSSRTRFSAGLAGQADERKIALMQAVREPANAELAAALQVAEGEPVLRMETISHADGTPISRSTHCLPAERFPQFTEIFQETGSITATFQRLGVPDYLRRSSEIVARHATDADLQDLGLGAGGIVLEIRAVSTDAEGLPLLHSVSRFAADRIELKIDHSSGDAVT